MTSVVRSLRNLDNYIDQFEDPRSGKWFLVSTPMYPIVLCLIYVYVVKVLGPRLMKNKKPFDLHRVLIIYNLFQVIFNSWMFYEFASAGWLTKEWSYKCEPMDYSENPRALRMATACWWFYISKYVDFLDTIFFILRKKDNQISKLHVIHHGMVPLSTWVGVKFTPGGHGTLVCFLNSFVHVVMYAYYLLAAFGPNVQKYLWWKKYITTLQIIQFVLLMVHSLQLFTSDCNYPRGAIFVVIFNAITFLVLFSQFYKETYNKRRKTSNCKPFNDKGYYEQQMSNGIKSKRG